MKWVTASLIGLLVASPMPGQEPVQQEREHVVKKGDTLWDLAGSYLNNPFRWRLIYEANTTVVEDPHWIYPDEVLVIPGMVESVLAAEPGAPPTAASVQPLDRPARTIFYRAPVEPPAERQATVLRERVLEGLPVKPGEFTSALYLADPGTLARYGRMIQPKREMARMRGANPTAHPRDEVFLTRDSDVAPTLGERLVLVDVGRRVPSAGAGQRVISPTAVVEVLEVTDEVIRASVMSQFGEVLEGQLLIPLARFPDFALPAAHPIAGGSDLRGRILEFAEEQPLYGPTDLGFIDLGREDGVSVGDIFVAYLPERAAREGGTMFGTTGRAERLPPEVVAELRVVRVMDRTATVKVDEVEIPQLKDGIWVQRIRKMP